VLVQSTSANRGETVTATRSTDSPAADLDVTEELPVISESDPGTDAQPPPEPAANADNQAAADAVTTTADARPEADNQADAHAVTTTEAQTEATPAGKKAWRAPGLDGVRALAVLSVLCFHEGLSWIPGGFLGVDMFFVLSGFLITDLLAAKFARDGNVGLNTFWQRRARRLLPALALMLLTVTAAVTVLEPSQRGTLPPALLGAITYTSNWWQAFAHQSYFSLYGPPPVFQHLWSLAVEEQFYLLWPLLLAAILLLVRNRAVRVLIVWVLAIGSALTMMAIYVPGHDPSLVYYGTDTHAMGLLIGAALALTWPLKKVAAMAGRMRIGLDIAGVIGLGVLAWCMWDFSGSDRFVYPYGLVIASLAAGGLVLAATAPGRVGGLLSWAPLRWLGIRSYGVYLWHWPVIAITVGMYPRTANTLGAHLIDAALPIGLAAASWRWLEEPILRNGFRAELKRRWQLLRDAPKAIFRAPAATSPAVFGAAVVLALACTAGYGLANTGTGLTLQKQIEHASVVISGTNAQPPTVTYSTGQANPWWLKAGTTGYRAVAHKQKPVRVLGSKIVMIGDSVMLASAPELAEALPDVYINAQVSRAMIAGILLVQQLRAEHRLRPILIVGLGTNGPITLYQIDQLRAAIGPHRWLLLVNVFEPRFWEGEVNSTIGAAVRRYPNVMLINWHNAIEHHQNLLWSDDIHPMPIGGTFYAKVVRKVVLRALRHPPRVRHKAAAPPDYSGTLLHANYARPS
jgi:peptidoglycan/LPS O-acetylase OafA/YrhL